MNTSYYPINLNIKGRRCIVIGGGKVAERKVKTLLKFDGRVTVVSPEITLGLKNLASKRRINHINKIYNSKLLNASILAIAATDDRKVNSRVSKDCFKKGILVNVVDSPKECSFIAPAIVKKGFITIAISTGGRSPVLSKAVRIAIEKNWKNMITQIRKSGLRR